MSKILTLDEMLDIFESVPELQTHYEPYKFALELIGSDMAEKLGLHFAIQNSRATREHSGLCGTAASFWPSYEGQAIPEPLLDYDGTSDDGDQNWT